MNRIDNVRTAIAVGAGALGTINERYRAYAQAVGFHIDALAEPTRRSSVGAR